MYKKKAMIKECQKNQISCFNPSGYIEEINKEKRKRPVTEFSSRETVLYECRVK